jgi:hypothetical protein
MDKGLDNHYRMALSDVKSILDKWESGAFESNKDAYMKLFHTGDRNDNNIARIYNDKGGSRWVELMSLQIKQGVITCEDLSEFDEDVRNAIMMWSGMI